MSTNLLIDAVDLAIAKLRRIPKPEAGSNMDRALTDSIDELAEVLGILERAGAST